MGKKAAFFIFKRAKFSFLLGEMLRDETKKAWLRIHARPFKGVCLKVRMLRNFWKDRHGYSECNRVLRVDKRVSTEMSVRAFCGLTCAIFLMIPLTMERKY